MVAALMREISIPCLDFEAIVQITGIAFPQPTTLGDVEFIRGSPTLLKEWDLWSHPWRPQWRGQTVARMKVKGGTVRAAQHRALERASMLCDELRIAHSSSLMVHLDDIDLAFGTGWNKVRGNGSSIHGLGRLAGKPVLWNEESFRAALDYLTPLYDLRATARPGVQERVELAIRWFGMARSVGTPWATKLIALFAGLEAILIKGEGERRKGATLAIRAALLSIAQDGHFRDPGDTLVLYRDRSKLVHGAGAAVGESVFRHTFSVAADALRGYITFANQETQAQRHASLLDALAASERLSDLKLWIERYRPRDEKELLGAIYELSLLRRPSSGE